jgi:NTP pyrophosphatase (non-canonical NTP hydrolase)
MNGIILNKGGAQMTTNSKLKEIKEYRLEDWVKIFGDIYGNANAERNASLLWLEVIAESSNIAEYVRREQYRRAIDTIPDLFSYLLSFVAKYSIYATDNVIQNEGIDLRSDEDSSLYLTEWILKEYPGCCSVCAKKPCICPASRYESEARFEDSNFAEMISTRLMKQESWENEIADNIASYNVERLFNMFNEIYGAPHHDQSVSSICFRFLEEVGEVARLLLSFDSIRILRMKKDPSYEEDAKYLSNALKGEVSDVISWIMALISKVNFIYRLTYPHYQRIHGKESTTDITYQHITLSELLLNRFYDIESDKFTCPHCASEECLPQCKENRLINETENVLRREDELMHEIRKAMGHEKRKYLRKKTQIRTTLDGKEINIVNIGKNNIGFLSNEVSARSEEKNITIEQNDAKEYLTLKITRPSDADNEVTGFKYFHGAEILKREIEPQPAEIHPSS